MLAPQLRGGLGIAGRHEVGLRQREHARQRRQPRIVRAQLGLDRRVVCERVRAVGGIEVEHVHEQARALDVGEEVVAQAGALAGALDEPGDVGDDELALGALERPEHGLERRERVRADLRRGARHPREQRRLAGVRDADEPDVGEQLQAQVDPALLADEPALGEPRRLPGRRREALVAAPASATARDDDALAG